MFFVHAVFALLLVFRFGQDAKHSHSAIASLSMHRHNMHDVLLYPYALGTAVHNFGYCEFRMSLSLPCFGVECVCCVRARKCHKVERDWLFSLPAGLIVMRLFCMPKLIRGSLVLLCNLPRSKQHESKIR